jgi:hypothetical protein
MTFRVACATEHIGYTILLRKNKQTEGVGLYMERIEENQSNGMNTQNSSYYQKAEVQAEVYENGNGTGYRAIDETKEICLTRKRLLMFPYPVFVTLVYLTIGCVFNWWHPTWLVFLTIPLYYPLVAGMDEKECLTVPIRKRRF